MGQGLGGPSSRFAAEARGCGWIDCAKECLDIVDGSRGKVEGSSKPGIVFADA